MTLGELRSLYTTYVPHASRHPNAGDGPQWWPTHELGHLLVALPHEIGEPMFGFDLESVDYVGSIALAQCIECAAMAISRKLLIRCGRADLADEESEGTDYHTMEWWDLNAGKVKRFIRRRGVARIPRTITGLETMLKRKVAR